MAVNVNFCRTYTTGNEAVRGIPGKGMRPLTAPRASTLAVFLKPSCRGTCLASQLTGERMR